MRYQTEDTRIIAQKRLSTPKEIVDDLPLSSEISRHIFKTRKAISEIIYGADNRLFVLIGPCSIHDPIAANEYADLLSKAIETYQDNLFIAMRCYFEKPRTTIGWKGLINDPDMDESFKVNKGLRMARKVLYDVCEKNIATGTEYLDTITPQYIADLISWSAIGARTTESQVHRQLASGLSSPVGFKNSTDGNIQIAIDAVLSARHSHTFLSTTKNAKGAIFTSTGNKDCHIILRGGKNGTNYDEKSIQGVCEQLKTNALAPRVMVDLSHANSQKIATNQIKVAENLAYQLQNGSNSIFGVMIESNLVEGNQKISKDMTYGQSITDACINFKDSEKVLDYLAKANEKRIKKLKK